MQIMEPTYFLYAGKLFHETALPFLATVPRTPRRGDDPGPTGPEEEPVGDEEPEGGTPERPSPGPGAPIVPEHGSPDANPIDPRVF
jgi:hypothetical protein